MRLTPWLRAAVAPALAVTAALVCTPPTDTSAQAGSQEQTLYVSAVDKNGAPVEGLGPDAFIVKENDVRREILHVDRVTGRAGIGHREPVASLGHVVA